MKKVALFSVLLIAGIVVSQLLPALAGEAEASLRKIIEVLTMVGLAFIMIHVGYEFEIDKSRLGSYGWDYLVAMTAAKTSRAAATVASMSSSVWAVERKRASYWLQGR